MNQSGIPEEKKTLLDVIFDAFGELKETFVAFVKSPRALWGINLPYVLEGLVYFGILTILGKFSSENVGLSDVHASWVYSWVTGGITLAMVLLGGLSDKFGVRRSLLLAFALMLIGRIFVAYSGSVDLGKGLFSPTFILMFFGLTWMVIGYGLYQPAAYAGVKRFTTPKTASMGYAVIYGLMNLGAFFSGFISPFIRHRFETTFPPNGLPAVFWVYVIITGFSLLFTALILTRKADKEAVERVLQETKEMQNDSHKETSGENPVEELKEKVNNKNLFLMLGFTVLVNIVFIIYAVSYNIISETMRYSWIAIDVLMVLMMGYEYLRHRPDHPFRDARFLFFIFILIPVQTLFAHNWLTIPYYLDRAFRGSVVSNYFELFSNINPILIFVLTPIVAGLTARANIYKMMIYGTLVMALPTFLLALGPRIELFLLYILLMSVGEAMWQPRFLQWIAEIAPEGKTGAYMGIGQLPWFLTKVLTGMYSGYFVAKYCPIPGPGVVQHTEIMWLFHGSIAIISPIALILAKNWMMSGMKTKHSEA
jgi:MFS family permease